MSLGNKAGCSSSFLDKSLPARPCLVLPRLWERFWKPCFFLYAVVRYVSDNAFVALFVNLRQYPHHLI